jgi:magnesium-transporting ATPase (P-type)
MAGKGQRVIACAMLELSATEYPQGHEFTTESCPSDKLVFLGLVALQDPPKPGTIYNISYSILCAVVLIEYIATCICS